MRQTILDIEGMDCPDEANAIRKALGRVPSVSKVEVALLASTVTIQHEETVSSAELIETVNSAGVTATLATRGGKARRAETEGHGWGSTLFVGISGLLTGTGVLLGWLGFEGAWVEALFYAAIAAGGWLVAPKAVASLRRLQLDMNILMTAAVLGSILIGEHAEGAAVIFLFSLAELLESYSVARARHAVQSLLDLAPDKALRKTPTGWEEVDAGAAAIGDVILIKSGERIPLDGEVVDGSSAVNQAPITGESVPVEKEKGATVFAGTINGEGSLEIKVTKHAGDTMLARIINLIEQAQEQKAPAQRFVDVFSKYYTPAVFFVAIGVALVPLVTGGAWQSWFYQALVLLVIACPCALVISTPVSIVSGLTAMARKGVLIKGGIALEEIGKLRALALDKTGTITEGKPKVLGVIPLHGADPREVVRIAAGVNSGSSHPLAHAVSEYAAAEKIPVPKAERYQSVTGRGAEAYIDDHAYFVGNHRFTHELGLCSPEIEKQLAAIEEKARSVIVVGHKPHEGCGGELIGILEVGDTIRQNARDAIADIHRAGVEKVVMLSGDNQRTANAIASEAGIDEVFGGLLPDDKVEHVRKLVGQYRHVGMVGDGVNDAPAMAAASIGISMGAAGTDTAIETSDLALMQDDLAKIAEAVRAGRQTLGVIQFNIAFSLVIKAVFLVLALLDMASLWMAILADTGATLLVIANALRLLRK